MLSPGENCRLAPDLIFLGEAAGVGGADAGSAAGDGFSDAVADPAGDGAVSTGAGLLVRLGASTYSLNRYLRLVHHVARSFNI
jgi:hypothetical protein